MATYFVSGVIYRPLGERDIGVPIVRYVEAENGAEAIHLVASDFRPVFPKWAGPWKAQNKQWHERYVRLNAVQQEQR